MGQDERQLEPPHKPLQKIAAGRRILSLMMPYMTTLSLNLVPYERKGMGTMGVTKDMILMYDPDALAPRKPASVARTLAHECLHILQKHHDRGEAMGDIYTQRQFELLNLAADCTLFPLLRDAGMQMDEGLVSPEMFDFPENMLMEEYYRMLCALDAEGKMPDIEIGLESGQCGSAGGNPLPNEPQANNNQKAEKPNFGDDEPDNVDSSERPPDNPGPGGDDGGEGGYPGTGEGDGPMSDRPVGRTRSEIENLRRATAEDIKNGNAGRGTIPAGLQRWADLQLQPPVVPWETQLARAARQGVVWAAGKVDHRFDGPSRRQAALGYGPGSVIMPRLRAPIPSVTVVIDTSASMGKAEGVAAISETLSLLKTCTQLTVMSCDAAVHETGVISKPADLAKYIKGGGGTSFCPAFDHINKQHNRPDLVVVITDGGGDAPSIIPGPYRVIWLLVGKHRQRPFVTGNYGEEISWGSFIEVPDNDEAQEAA
jgi:predicted metal-dependent peptidase